MLGIAIKRARMTDAAGWVIFVLFIPAIVVLITFYDIGFLARKALRYLNHVDATPWNQAVVLGAALSLLILLFLLGEYAGW